MPLPEGVVLWPRGVPPGGPSQKVDLIDHILSIASHNGKPGTAEAHDEKDDIFYIQSGTSDFLVGGTFTGKHSIGPGEVQGTGIDGATLVHLQAGDVITIPAGMPHRYLTKPDEKVNYFIVKIVKHPPIAPPTQQMEGMPPGVLVWHNGTPPEGLDHKANFGDHILYGYHRAKSGAIEYHEAMDDVFIVEDGGSDFLVGGTGVGMHVTGKGEQQGTAINGATRVHLSKGDIITIPAKMPHQFVLAEGQTLDYFIIKVLK